MTLKELLERDFKVELPISGGDGNSIDDPIIIHKKGMNDYVGTEHFILRCMGIGLGIEWKKLGQELIIYNNKKIDKITIERKRLIKGEIINQKAYHYFDITECF